MANLDSLKTDRTLKNAVQKLTKEQFALLRSQIKRDGILTPLICWKRNGSRYVVDGNHRLACAKQLGLKHVPIIEKSFPDKNAALMFIYEFCAGQRNLPLFSLIEVTIKKFELRAHAPEIVQDEKGDYFISSADYPQRGINLARLVWKSSD